MTSIRLQEQLRQILRDLYSRNKQVGDKDAALSRELCQSIFYFMAS